ncbi:hypothetical protein SDC9_199537 [bioreactor metagenome]|uniref:HTH gntR-type domain-containing protein n=1 Tax=bioreactor metagenome TaxID=1076179 RepID=A0A645IKU1_9ZZZZ|nr:GntR family transcriptional regulator [Oscillospiraceae bacterium]
MFVIDYTSKAPIFEQIKTQILSFVSCGALKPGDRLPSIRMISSELSINFNTVKKVFSDLERDGVIITVIGSGSFIAKGAVRNHAAIKNATAALTEAAAVAKAAGINEDEATKIINHVYKTEEGNK